MILFVFFYCMLHDVFPVGVGRFWNPGIAHHHLKETALVESWGLFSRNL